MQKVIASKPHPIVMQRGAIQSLCEFIPENASNVRLITDIELARLYGNDLHAIDPNPIVVPRGEEAKSLPVAVRIWEALQQGHLDRQSVLVGVGGGAVCDVTGWIAGSTLRGVRVVLVPTTALAMVDAAIGGKSALNFGKAKNFLGLFTPPHVTVIDPSALQTLPQRELANGMAEVIKIAVMKDRAFFDTLSLEPPSISLDDTIIAHAAALKAKICENDPFDHGERALLNYGHTVGHALEAVTSYTLPHGHAVAIGMVCAAKISVHKTLADQTIVDALSEALLRHQLPICIPKSIAASSLLALLPYDKKARAGDIRFVLPRTIGHGTVVGEIEERLIIDVLKSSGAS